MISINEIKTSLPLSIPGYKCYKSVQVQEAHRGGTAVFIKNYLTPFITHMDESGTDQVWAQFSCVTGVVFGFCYIPPSDSPYYNHFSFSAIQEKIRSSGSDKEFVIIGDLNSDHAPISLEIVSRGMDMNQMCLRAGQLGQHWPWGTQKPGEVKVRKAVRFKNIDKDLFLSNLSKVSIRCDGTDDVHKSALKICESLYLSATSSPADPVQHWEVGGLDCWAGLLSDPDDRRVWEAIDWKGKYQERERIGVVPSDQEFKLFYENSYG